MRFLPVNLSHLLVELSSLKETLALYESIKQADIPAIQDMVPAAKTLLIHYIPWLISAEELVLMVRKLEIKAVLSRQTRSLTIPVDYQGEDLNEVAELLGISISDVIRKHTEQTYQVAFTGFAPGFAYLISEETPLYVPRKKTPRTRIPAGSVGLAGEFSGVYPQQSPGGWQLIGTTEIKMWDLSREQPAFLLPGNEVHFVDAKKVPTTISLPEKTQDTHLSPLFSTQGLYVISAGLQTLFQDEGRIGAASMGVSASGALDKPALHAANRLVGNPPTLAVLEITQGGLTLKARQDCVMALTGADCVISLKHEAGDIERFSGYQPLDIRCGDELTIGVPIAGVRSYLAVRGGFSLPKILGSHAFDTLAQIGPNALREGDVLHLNSETELSGIIVEEQPLTELPKSGDTVTLDVILGPRADWFTADAIKTLTSQLWQVTPQSNRIGLRLLGNTPLEREQKQELSSEGTCIGAIQVPINGQPVLFLNDHPLTGGYPVIGAVAEYHLPLAGQIPVNANIRFNPITPFQEY
ncbi:allophanate hydrolase 2 subunit 1/allophanate hydrolase 2 subunit 2 [Proteus hauseri ATCC 700826]|uniref:Allophanate hydrolase 2 subunit 1/allophanate hydrolase 2 subunit 2 n=1 Tax=Proteus hauseri ATCC 700826 TaxID=1354271 RepID=A0AAJ3HU13_PROHU|nr:5-oxoprolinase/urea amidolyase family protein [Proteus hauseri]OAT49056.1 allophanate hydrolase 2 subunit 1/allophanate hydrolase 2 subunit 2 [Proteus hauseri ATCC 700826]